jgi:uncharacterized protein
MKATEGKIGRVFILRLEDGDIVPDCIEEFCRKNNVLTGNVLLIGGIGAGQVVVGPRVSSDIPPEPMILPIDGAHEVVGIGIIAPDSNGKPLLHIHAALGRSGKTTTGCLRPGVTTWLVGEAVISEILGADATRKPDTASGLVLLQVDS